MPIGYVFSIFFEAKVLSSEISYDRCVSKARSGHASLCVRPATTGSNSVSSSSTFVSVAGEEAKNYSV